MGTNLWSILPELVLAGTLVLVLAADLLLRGRPDRPGALTLMATLGLVGAGVALATLPGTGAFFDGLVVGDPLGRFFRGLFLVAGAMGLWFGLLSEEVPRTRFGEFVVLILAATMGTCLLVQSRNLLMIAVSLELISLPSYALAGFRRGDRLSSEAALKYVLYGAASTGLMLYGMSLLYGLAGTLDLPSLAPALGRELATGAPWVRLGLAMGGLFTLAGLAYKVSAVPFHAWAPDVYQGAPTPVTAFLSVGPKAAGVAAMIRFLSEGFGSSATGQPFFPWPVVIGLIAMATMTVGNLAALAQDNVKRLLAWSSIAHAGYLLVGVSVGTPEAIRAVALYAPVYLLMNLGAFLAVLAVRHRTGAETMAAYRGLGTRSPWIALSLVVFLFSLTGLPPLAGFIGKFYLFAAALQVGGPFFLVLALVGVLNSVISLYYYARLVRTMFLDRGAGLPPVAAPRPVAWLLLVLAVPTLVLGLFWSPLAALASWAAGLS